MKYRLKNTQEEIDAILLPEVNEPASEEFIAEMYKFLNNKIWYSGRDGSVDIFLHFDGPSNFEAGSWIIKDSRNQFRSATKEAFNQYYEKVDA